MNTSTTQQTTAGAQAQPKIVPPDYNWDLSGITYNIEAVTPEQAHYWTVEHVRNRDQSDRYAEKLLGIYNRGHWLFNGMPIVFDRDGNLIEGQHRLDMIYRSGRPLQMLVVRGVDPEAFKTYDLQRRRTLADLITADRSLSDTESARTVAGAVGFTASYLKNRRFRTSSCVEDERMEVFNEHRDGLRKSAELHKAKNPFPG
jgi:hypothetical protein